MECPSEECGSDADVTRSAMIKLEINPHNQSSGSSNSANTSSSSSSLELSLLQDTKLVVLHYISTTCSSSNSSFLATPSPQGNLTSTSMPSPIYSLECNNSGKRVRIREGISKSDSEHCRRRRVLRPRFHSSPAISRTHLLSTTKTPAKTPKRQQLVDTVDGADDDLCACQCHGKVRNKRPPLKLDIRDSNLDEFSYVTPEERLQFDIANEVSRTLVGLNDGRSDGLSFVGTPHTKIANFLKIIGDKYDEDIRLAMEGALQREVINDQQPLIDYDQFMRIMDYLNGTPYLVTWNRVFISRHSLFNGHTNIALVLRLAKELVAYLLRQGRSGLTFLADYTTRFIFDRAAAFLIRNGGWGTVANLSPTNPLFTSPSASSLSSSSSPGLRENGASSRHSGSDRRGKSRWRRAHPVSLTRSTNQGLGARPKTYSTRSNQSCPPSHAELPTKSSSDTYLSLPVDHHCAASSTTQRHGDVAPTPGRFTPKSWRNSPCNGASSKQTTNARSLVQNGGAGNSLPTLRLMDFIPSRKEDSPGSSLSCLESDTSDRSMLGTPCSSTSTNSNDLRSN